MKKNKALIGTLTVVSIVVLGTLSFAGPMRGMGGGYGDCPAGNRNAAVEQLTQEKRDLLKSILDEHRKETSALHESMWEKRTLLRALSVNPNTKPETLTALVKEIGQLRTQMQTQREALQTRVAKEVGIEMPFGFGRGEGHRGHGRDGSGRNGCNRDGSNRDGFHRDGQGRGGFCPYGADLGRGAFNPASADLDDQPGAEGI